MDVKCTHTEMSPMIIDGFSLKEALERLFKICLTAAELIYRICL